MNTPASLHPVALGATRYFLDIGARNAEGERLWYDIADAAIIGVLARCLSARLSWQECLQVSGKRERG